MKSKKTAPCCNSVTPGHADGCDCCMYRNGSKTEGGQHQKQLIPRLDMLFQVHHTYSGIEVDPKLVIVT